MVAERGEPESGVRDQLPEWVGASTMQKSMPESEQKAAGGRGEVQALVRALEVLEYMTAVGGEASLSEVAAAVSLPRSTTHRLLNTLLARGFTAQDPESGRYCIGPRSFVVGSAYAARNALRRAARPLLQELAAQTGETVNLAIREADEAIYLDQIQSRHILQAFVNPGAAVPLYCTGVGKALMLGMTESELHAYLDSIELAAFTPKTLARAEPLLADLRRARARGYALDDEERELGVCCAAAPIVFLGGQAMAAVSVSAPSYRASPARLHTFGRSVRQSADRIAGALRSGR